MPEEKADNTGVVKPQIVPLQSPTTQRARPVIQAPQNQAQLQDADKVKHY